ncbi:von Willebrand factor A domain-containing 3B, partial [Brachionus plicatilis]
MIYYILFVLIPSPKLVNAKYCDQFAHVLWNDGTIMHVHVTPDLHRNYEQNITMYLEMYEKRIDWLSKGSRELFGTVIESNICILVDTSQSMHLSLDFVKRKLQVLIQEQLRNKQRFNLIGFNSKIYPWRDRMVEVDEFNIKSALEWINCLSAHGTTNTLAAIRFALSDLNTEAIYLLSDGRPDQEPRQILSQVHLNTKIPIHTISFNCNDSEANKFLSKLAEETNGRYHYFNESGWDADPYGPIPYQSEDISLLKKEIEKGRKYLLQMSILREECAKLSVKQEIKGAKILKKRCIESQSCNFESKYDSKTSYEKAKIGFNLNNGVLGSLHDINSLEWVLPETRILLERQFRKQPSFVKENPKYVEKIPSPKKKRSTSNIITGSKIFKWLQKNSLEKLKLTIFDVLQNKSDCINNLVVDELFNAKIWTEIMETAENSKIDKSKFQLINPSKIDWNSYQSKLDEQIAQYKKYLVEAIWEKPPIDYDKNKSNLLNSLEYSNWP